MAGEPGDVLALGRRVLELEAGGQQQLAARQPRRRVDDLGDVHPADGAVDARLARHEPDVEVAQEVTQRQHGVTDRRPSYADSDNLSATCDRRNERGSVHVAVDLSYDRTGSGPPLLLLHGLGMCKEMWRPVVPLLAREREVVAVDLPGFGASPRGPRTVEGSPRPGGLRRRPRARAPARGGQLARRRRGAGDGRDGHRALGLRAVAGRLRGRAREARTRARCSSTTRVVSRALPRWRRALARSAVLRTLLSSHVAARPWRIPPEDAATGCACTRRRRRSGSCSRRSTAGARPSPACPTTIAWGERDRLLISSRQAPRARRALPDARHVTLRGCGHVPTWDDPEQVAAGDPQRLSAGPSRVVRGYRRVPGRVIARGDSRGPRRAARSPRPRASAAASPARRRRRA